MVCIHEKQEKFEWTEITAVHGLGGKLILEDGQANHTLNKNGIWSWQKGYQNKVFLSLRKGHEVAMATYSIQFLIFHLALLQFLKTLQIKISQHFKFVV